MRHLPARLACVLAAIAAMLAGPATTSAHAATNPPCRAPFQHLGQTVQYCPVWVPSGGIPVFKSPVDHTVVGRLYSGGYANWFGCQVGGSGSGLPAYHLDGYSSNWYSYTLSDPNSSGTSHWGFVSGVFYAGSTPYFYGLNACV